MLRSVSLVAVLIFSMGANLASCGSECKFELTLLKEDEDILVNGYCLSISPDESECIYIVCDDSIARGLCKFGLVSMDLSSLQTTRHEFGGSASSLDNSRAVEIFSTALDYRFHPTGWAGNRFYVDALYSYIEINPLEKDMDFIADPFNTEWFSKPIVQSVWLGDPNLDSKNQLPKSELEKDDEFWNNVSLSRLPDLSCSDCCDIVRMAKMLRECFVEGVSESDLRDRIFARHVLMGANVCMAKASPDSFIYFLGPASSHREGIFRYDGSELERVYSYGGIIKSSTITQLRISPHGEYLAFSAHEKLVSPIPLPGGNGVLYVIDVSNNSLIYKSTFREIGGLMWGTDEPTLYFASRGKETGVFRLKILVGDPRRGPLRTLLRRAGGHPDDCVGQR